MVTATESGSISPEGSRRRGLIVPNPPPPSRASSPRGSAGGPLPASEVSVETNEGENGGAERCDDDDDDDVHRQRPRLGDEETQSGEVPESSQGGDGKQVETETRTVGDTENSTDGIAAPTAPAVSDIARTGVTTDEKVPAETRRGLSEPLEESMKRMWKLVLLDSGMRIFRQGQENGDELMDIRFSALMERLSTVTVRLARGIMNIIESMLFLSPPPAPLTTASDVAGTTFESPSPQQPLIMGKSPFYKSYVTIQSDPLTVFTVLLDVCEFRGEWDHMYEGGTVVADAVSTSDAPSDYVHLTLSPPPSVWNSAAKRDLALQREFWRDEGAKGDSYVIVHRSTDSIELPECLPGVVRAHAIGWAYVIVPLGASSEKCVVTQLLEINAGGWTHLLPMDATNQYTLEILRSILGLRDLFAQASVADVRKAISREAHRKAAMVAAGSSSSSTPTGGCGDGTFERDVFQFSNHLHYSDHLHYPFEMIDGLDEDEQHDDFCSGDDDDFYYDDSDMDEFVEGPGFRSVGSEGIDSSETVSKKKKRPYRRVRSAFWKAAKKGASLSYKAAKSGLGSKSASKALYRRYKRGVRRTNSDDQTRTASNGVQLSENAFPKRKLTRSSSTGSLPYPVEPNGRTFRSGSETGSSTSSGHEGAEHEVEQTAGECSHTPALETSGTGDDEKVPSVADILSSKAATIQYLHAAERLEQAKGLVTCAEKFVKQNVVEKVGPAAIVNRVGDQARAAVLGDGDDRCGGNSDDQRQSPKSGDGVVLRRDAGEVSPCASKTIAPAGACDICPLLSQDGGGSMPFGSKMAIENLSASKPNPRDRAEGSSSSNCWGQPSGTLFSVRGSNYLADKVKVQGSTAAFQLAAVDWFSSDAIIDGIGENADCCPRRTLLKDNDDAFCFIVNMQVPLGAQHRSLVLYYVAQSKFDEKDTLLGQFINGDDAFQAERFKLIPNIAFGPLVVRKSVGNKPLIVRNALATKFVRGDRYFEVDINIGSSSVAFYVVKLVLGYVRKIVVDIAFLIEGKTAEELRDNETIVGTVRINRMEPDAHKEYPRAPR